MSFRIISSASVTSTLLLRQASYSPLALTILDQKKGTGVIDGRQWGIALWDSVRQCVIPFGRRLVWCRCKCRRFKGLGWCCCWLLRFWAGSRKGCWDWLCNRCCPCRINYYNLRSILLCFYYVTMFLLCYYVFTMFWLAFTIFYNVFVKLEEDKIIFFIILILISIYG
jgi:hypothetical protein